MAALTEALRKIDEGVARIVDAARLRLVWPLAYAVAAGAAVWAWFHPDLVKRIESNKLSWAERLSAAQWLGYAAGGVLLVYLAGIAVARVRSGKWAFSAPVDWLNRRLAPLLGLPFIAALRTAGIETREPIWTVLLAVCAAVPVAVAAYALEPPDEERELPRWREIAARIGIPVAVVAIGIAYAYFFSRLAITNHHALTTKTTDLGYYDNIFYQSLHGRPLGCTFMKGEYHGSGHFDPILVLLSPLYLIYPRAELLLVLQSVWLGAGVVPVYLLAREKLASRLGALGMVVLWVVNPSMHGANLYEFHSLTLIAPLVVWLLLFLELGAFKRYWFMLAVLWLCREDIPLLMCCVGAYAVLKREHPYARVGWITIAASLVYFVVVKRFFMTSPDLLNAGKESYGFAYYFADLIPERRGAGELLLSLLTNPIFALQHAFANEKKILYLLILFVPFALLPLFARGARVMFAYGLFISLAASREPVFTPHFQYGCLIFPIAFAAAPMVLERIRKGDAPALFSRLDGRRLSRALVVFMVAVAVPMSWKFGAIVENASFRGGFYRVTRELSDDQKARYEVLQKMLALIPPGASVTVTNTTGPHASNRAKAYLYDQKKQTHYVLVYERELRKWVKTWHDARVAAGGLELLERERGLALYQTIPERDVTAGQARRAAKRASEKSKPAPTIEPAAAGPDTDADDESDAEDEEPEPAGD